MTTDPETQGAGLPPDDAYKVLLDHARSMWSAEEENARRHANRVNLELTVVLAVLGLGLFQAARGQAGLAGNAAWANLLLVFGVILIALGGLYLLGVVRGRKPKEASDSTRIRGVPASLKLRLESGSYDGLHEPEKGTAQYVRLQTFDATVRAANELAERNLAEARRIDTAQQFILFGLACFLIVSLASAFSKAPRADEEATIKIENTDYSIGQQAD